MDFNVNHPLFFALAGLVIIFVLGQSIFFLIKAYQEARRLGLASKVLRKVMAGSAIFSVAPAVAILLGLVTLSKFLGLPLPWMRLSVLGALTYELPAATSAAKAMDIPLNQTVTDPQVYATITWVMTLGILSGILVILFFQKKMEQGLDKVKNKDQKWSQIMMDSLFLGMIAAFMGMVFSDIRSGLVGWIPVFVMAFSALVMMVIGLMVKKLKWTWLENYAMPLSMLSAMAFAIPLTSWITGNH
ncbi:MAG: DUF5058 family protein [Eubacteriales bacterium]|nr:DUF5058 family protein [Clostridiales bacterium]MDY5836308.1 DUF5058 family protein [Eubacteriales bacterium]